MRLYVYIHTRARVGEGGGESDVERATRIAQERDESPFMKAPNGRVGVGVEPRRGLVIEAALCWVVSLRETVLVLYNLKVMFDIKQENKLF